MLTRRPAGLASPDLNTVRVACHGLNASHSLLHVIEVGSRSVADFLALPVCESVDQEQLDSASDKSIRRSIGIFVPAVRSSNQGAREHILDFVDLLEELGSGEVATVKSLRTNCDRIDLVFISGNATAQGLLICREGLIGIRPVDCLAAAQVNYPGNEEGNIPDTNDDLETLALASRNDVCRGIALAGGVCTHNLRNAAQAVEVGFIVLSGLAGPICILVSQSEAKCACCRGQRGSNGKDGRKQNSETHREKVCCCVLKYPRRLR